MLIQIASCKASDLDLPVNSGLQQSLVMRRDRGTPRLLPRPKAHSGLHSCRTRSLLGTRPRDSRVNDLGKKLGGLNQIHHDGHGVETSNLRWEESEDCQNQRDLDRRFEDDPEKRGRTGI